MGAFFLALLYHCITGECSSIKCVLSDSMSCVLKKEKKGNATARCHSVDRVYSWVPRGRAGGDGAHSTAPAQRRQLPKPRDLPHT